MFYLLLFAPLVGFLVNGLRFRSKDAKLAGTIACSAMAISFLSAIGFFFKLKGLPAEERILQFVLFDWIQVGNFNAPMAFTIDPLSMVMTLIITGVGFLIHLFSVGYMDHDERPAKYFSYLNLFVFNMLLLVLGSKLLVMFVGWEGVGLCSYLLIGFWFTDPAKATAGMKAFITNRIGDAGFLLGIFTLFGIFGTVSFVGINNFAINNADVLSDGGLVGGWGAPLTLACLFLFVGAMGKSAQIPLYVWLPDAMAGPTPVSALIHAATMVTAGVYMIIRLNPVFLLSPNAMFVVACVGAATALMAATIGVLQNDIKKVLAYSTVSQLGYMFLGVGVGAFGAALAHLMTHAFFKALMFLGSGSVIHAMHEEQDMRKMGGLRKQMPITHWTFVMGWLAIIGAPLFSGFFSKDEILWMAFHSPRGSVILWGVGFIAALFTAFYMTRLMAMTFWGKSRVPTDVHPHESPWTMTVPLVVLAFLSVFAGWLCVPHGVGTLFGHMHNYLDDWVHPLMADFEIPHGANDLQIEFMLMGFTMVMVFISASVAYYFYGKKPEIPEKNKESLKGLYDLVYNKYWVDEAYFKTLIQPLVRFSQVLWARVDVKIIDRVTYNLSDMVKNAGGGLKMVQSGNLQIYAMYILIGLVCSLWFLLEK
jgi:NADH-quinone oxidoreductase subunit L